MTPPTKLGVQRRTLTIDHAALSTRAADESRIPIALSSEAPVARWFGTEVLDHRRDAIDLARAEGGLPLLFNHDPDQLLGVIEDVRVHADGVVRGMARFSGDAEAQRRAAQVAEGVLRNTSIGYVIHELTQDRSEAGEDVYRATRWELLEGSLVSVPADQTVGVGRSADSTADYPVRVRTINAAPVAEETSTVSDTTTAAPVAVTDRGEQIADLCELAGFPERAVEFIRSSKSVTDIRNELAAARRSKQSAPIVAPAPSAPDYTDGDHTFSVARAIQAARTGNWREAGYERAVAEAEGKRLGQASVAGNAFFMPTGVSVRTSHSVATAGNGGNSVFTQPGSFIELLRNRSVVMQLGATVHSGLQGNVAFPRQTAAGTAYWLAELTGGSDVTESNTTLDQVTLSPKTVMAMQSYSGQLLAQSTLDVDSYVRSDLASVIARAIDLAAIHGSGASNQPQGIYGATGVNSVAMGGAVTYAKLTDMEAAIEADNADIGVMAFATTPEVKQDAKTTARFSSTDTPLWIGSAAQGELIGYRAVASNQVSKVLGAGTNEHGIVFGVWSELLIGEWGAVQITVDPYTKAGQDVTRVIARAFVDIDLRHPQAFCTGSGLTA